jgi:uncharacterized Zn-binding protein involved in type VI secretion
MPGRPAQRKGDFNSKGGIIIDGDSSVLINGRPAATPGLLVTPHPPCPKKLIHCLGLTLGGAMTVRVNGDPLLLTGDKDTCGDARSGGSSNVRAV